jgi:hypothetical protein
VFSSVAACQCDIAFWYAIPASSNNMTHSAVSSASMDREKYSLSATVRPSPVIIPRHTGASAAAARKVISQSTSHFGDHVAGLRGSLSSNFANPWLGIFVRVLASQGLCELQPMSQGPTTASYLAVSAYDFQTKEVGH